ncbi:MAG TPA: amidase family protein [Acidimicrobiales bacterium]|nr:amidase family protein [Acidimicrobiales bacterium]
METENDPALATLVATTAALAARELSARELLASVLARIERHNPALNAVVTLDAAGAARAAADADARRARGERCRPLEGIPMTVKDAIETAGLRSTSGAVQLADHLPREDAPAVARLREAGAIILGKTNVPAFATDSQTYNDLFGVTVNPFDPGRTSGGSSGGAAVATATGMTVMELGTDMLGSIRIPSAFCGVYGLKPTWGVVPQLGYLRDASGGTTRDLDINVFGPLARGPRDLEVLLQVLAGRRELRPPRAARRLEEYRVGVWLADPDFPVDQEVLDVLGAAVRALEGAGVRLEEVRPCLLAEATEVLFRIVPPIGFDPGRLPLADALRRQEGLKAGWARLFETVDVVLCPVAPTVAFPHDHTPDRRQRATIVNGAARPYFEGLAWTGGTGVAHLPVVAAPAGLSRSGLPVGVQVVAPIGGDLGAIRFAELLAEVCGGYVVPPMCR